MTKDRELDGILAEIGREHRALGAPQSLEAALLAKATNSSAVPGLRRLHPAWAWALAAALMAAIAVSGVVWQMRRGQGPRDRQARPVPSARPSPPSPPRQIEARSDVPPSLPPRRADPDRAPSHASSRQRAAISLDEFVPLPVSEGLPPASGLSVVRITLQGRDLQQYGLEAPADAAARNLLAEFVVGEDGLPRAIRIVR